MTCLARGALAVCLGCACLISALARASEQPAHEAGVSFAVLRGVPSLNAGERDIPGLLAGLGEAPGLAFVVLDGNLKASAEPCRDALFERRRALFAQSPLPLVYIPGSQDWIDCQRDAAGRFDPLERLDFIRQTYLSDAASLGSDPLPLTRLSDAGRFRTYREDVRWESGEVLFVGLNIAADNNHYLAAGGRNGEFEDRVIANTFWMRHAGEYARRGKTRAIVIAIDGDPAFSRTTRRVPFGWLGLGRRAGRDGYREFKRDLTALAETYRGPILLIHGGHAGAARQTLLPLEKPLRDAKGKVMSNVSVLTLPVLRRGAYVRVTVVPHGRNEVFHAALNWVAAATLDKQPPAPAASAPPPSMPSMPQFLPLPPASDSAPHMPGLDLASSLPSRGRPLTATATPTVAAHQRQARSERPSTVRPG